MSIALTRGFEGAYIIHGFAVDQSAMSREQFLVLTIILILIFEPVHFFKGVST